MDILGHLLAQRTDLVRKRDALRAEAAALDAEIADMDTAVRVVEKTVGQPTVAREAANGLDEETGRPTYRNIITRVLADASPRGLTVHEVVAAANRDHDVALTQNTASVMLGRIKTSGHATLNGRQWFYVSKT